jgi:radical SAM protein
MFYETTRACDLLCKHCRACAQANPHPRELTTEQSLALIDQIATFPRPPVLIFTGGDPFKRADISELVAHGVRRGLSTALTPSATPLVTAPALLRLREAGLGRLALSLDGADARTHDTFRGVLGSYRRTLEIFQDARAVGHSLQVNTTITRRNIDQIDDMAELMQQLGITLWSVFFLVPVGRGLAEERIHAEDYEYAFERLLEHSRTRPYGIKTTEAPHYRRFAMQHGGDSRHQPPPPVHPGAGAQPNGAAPPAPITRAPLGVGDGKGVFFVSHTGAVYPSGFMPILCGRFPADSVVDVYQNHPMFRALRDPDQLHGKCGMCEYRTICGGSRARAYAVTRDPLGAEPDCIHIPEAMRAHEVAAV